tara:strand:+ start:2434 stop:2625 length:192 start_codon:yes stop_codon:yes gene_type:complete
MEDVIDLIATDSSASEISDKIKDALYSKAAERVDALRPVVANSLFGGETETEEETVEVQTGEE